MRDLLGWNWYDCSCSGSRHTSATNLDQLLKEIEAEIARLQQARSLLLPDETRRPEKAAKSPGRRTRRRKMSAEAKERIRQAQIKRRAKAKKAAA